MAVPGRKPAAASQKRNRNTSQVDWVDVENVPYEGPRPDFIRSRTIVTREGQETVDLQAMTIAWWAVVSSMPHCVLWEQSDWMFALATATVADAAFCGVASAMTELRNREKVLGTTVEFRRDLRIRYIESEPDIVLSAEVTKLDDYRDL